MASSLWGGRFEKEMDEAVKQYNASIFFDQRMYNEDIDGSIAHVTMLAGQGIVTEDEAKTIITGLEEIRADIQTGKITFDVNDEDIHMGIESRLIARVGEVGKKLHTARSRNDQCQVDGRLYLRREIGAILERLKYLETVILDKAEQYADQISIGFTHLQHAQPLTLGFVFMAYFQMFKRDIQRLQDTLERMNYCPLGACALAGTTLPIDRHETARLLGFIAPTENAMDSVSDRDYSIEFLSDASISMMHLSRWAEEFAWWNSSEFSYIAIDDSFCTGSSIMPQKKNPDMAELIRGKSGRVYGNLVQLLVTMKGLPLAYNKDLQEDKEGALDTAHTLMQCLSVMAGMISTWTVNEDAMARECGVGHLAATDVADYLAKRGLPFREAHAVVGHLVLMCEKHGCNLEDLPFEVFQEASPLFERDITEALDIPSIVAARTTEGGTAPAAVAVQLERAEAQLVADEDVVGSLTKVVEMGHGAK